MSVWVVLIGLAVFILIPSTIGIVAAWTALSCYPWRRCGRCGWDEWRVFRRMERLP